MNEIDILYVTMSDESVLSVIEAEINKSKCLLLLDTGASSSIFSENHFSIYNEIECDITTFVNTGQRVKAGLLEEELKIADKKIELNEVILMDLTKLFIINSNIDLEIRGVLGLDVLRRLNSVINFTKNKFCFLV